MMYDELVNALRLCVKYARPFDALENAEQAADAIEELQKKLAFSEQNAKAFLHTAHKLLDEVPRWISVEERLPEEEGCYLVAVKNDHKRRYSKTAWFSRESWFTRQDVTHWMPLPEPPKEET